MAINGNRNLEKEIIYKKGNLLTKTEKKSFIFVDMCKDAEDAISSIFFKKMFIGKL